MRHSVPIFVDGQYWGIIAIDHCREKHQLTPVELSVFKTAAACVGSAIQRERLRRAEQRTQKAMLEERLRSETAILEERNRIARDIHDTLAQAFTGVILQLQATQRIVATDPDTADRHLIRAITLAREGLSEARRSVQALRPHALETQDLTTALLQMVEQMTANTPTQAEVCVEGTRRSLLPDVELNLLRIGQEALTNVVKHAQAQRVHLQLQFDSDTVQLHIVDDGQGFDPNDAPDRPGFGLIGIAERAQRLNAQFTLTSRIGVGTTIAVIVPLPPA